MIVNTNLSSLNAQRMLLENTKAASTAMERLATGSKINTAQDDVAGSAIADRMTSQVRGLNMALKNAEDARSMLSVAETMYLDQTDIVQRLRELAVQAANDTNSAKDREYMQSEVTALVAEMDRIAGQTMFNGESIGGLEKLPAWFGRWPEHWNAHNHSEWTFGHNVWDCDAGLCRWIYKS